MSKREKIVLFITLTTVLYDLCNLLFASPSESDFPDAGKKLAELRRFTADVAEEMAREAQTEADKFILARAGAAWSEKPFLKSGWSTASNEAGKLNNPPEIETPATGFTYSGYLATSDRKLAIINGIEYEVGDELAQPGYKVLSISPRRVLIEAPGGDHRIILPLEETP